MNKIRRAPGALARFVGNLLKKTMLGVVGAALLAALMFVLDAALLRDKQSRRT